MSSEWLDFIADVRASVQSFEEWPKDKGIGPVCPEHKVRHMIRVASYTYRCTDLEGRDYAMRLDAEEGIIMLPTSRIAGVNP